MKKILLFVAGLMLAMSASAQTYYLNGTLPGLDWNFGYSFEGSTTIACEGGVNYQFKVTDAPAWGQGEFGFDALESVPEGVTNAGTGDVAFLLPQAGDVTISMVDGKVVLTSSVGFGEFVKPEWDGTYFIAGKGVEGSGFACDLEWNEKECPLTDGTVTYTALPAGDYAFKITNGTWDSCWGYTDLASAEGFTEGENNNVLFTLDSASDVTISYDGSSLTVTINGEGGDDNTGDDNTGDDNTGDDNTGDDNTGDDNTGDDITPSSTTYYLVGYINGADYGCEGDYENMGDYKFVDGSLTATFDADSYVFIKTEGNGKWFLFETYCEEASGVLAEGNGEKMKVPGGEELTFTLVENGDGSLTLSYTTGTTTDLEDVDAEDAVVAAYDLLGRPVAADAAGYVILQYASGKAVKVFNN